MGKTNYFELAKQVKEDYPLLRFSSGRWIYDEEFYQDFDCIVMDVILPSNPNYSGVLCDSGDSRKLEAPLIRLYQKEGEKPWHLSLMARKALEKGKSDVIPSAFYGMTAKQMLIASRILLHHADENECFFIIQGKGGSGKSTFLNILIQLEDNDFSPAQPEDFSGHTLGASIRSRLVGSDDASGSFLDNGKVKTICTGGRLQVNDKLKDPYFVTPQCQMVFLSNPKPYFDIHDSGMMRRVIWYVMDSVVKNPDPKMKNRKYKEEELIGLGQYLIGIDSLVKDSWKAPFMKETKDCLASSSSVGKFRRAKTDLKDYEEYSEFCKHNGFKSCNSTNFVEIMMTLDDWEKEDGVFGESVLKTVEEKMKKDKEEEMMKTMEDLGI